MTPRAGCEIGPLVRLPLLPPRTFSISRFNTSDLGLFKTLLRRKELTQTRFRINPKEKDYFHPDINYRWVYRGKIAWPQLET